MPARLVCPTAALLQPAVETVLFMNAWILAILGNSYLLPKSDQVSFLLCMPCLGCCCLQCSIECILVTSTCETAPSFRRMQHSSTPHFLWCSKPPSCCRRQKTPQVSPCCTHQPHPVLVCPCTADMYLPRCCHQRLRHLLCEAPAVLHLPLVA